MSLTQKYYGKFLLAWPRLSKYYRKHYGVNASDLSVIYAIYNGEINGNKIRRRDIINHTGFINATVDAITTKLKHANIIDQSYIFTLTDQGRKIVRSLPVNITNTVKQIDGDTNISISDYNQQCQRDAAHNYKVKKGIIKEPGKRNKYYKKFKPDK